MGKRAVTLVAAALGVLAVVAPAAGAGGERVKRVTVDRYPFSISIDGGQVRASGVAGERSVRSAGATAAASGAIAPGRVLTGGARSSASGYACVNNRRRRGFVAYAPFYRTASNKKYYILFTYNLYKQNVARKVNGHRTKQFEMCSVGGAHARGGNHLSRVATSFIAIHQAPRIVGWKWGKGVRDNGSIAASLTFSVPVKPVTISGTVSVHDQDKFTGSQGPDQDAPDRFKPYVYNQVNGLWEGSSTFRWQGSTHFEGNVAHGLWEIKQVSHNLHFDAAPTIRYFCGHPFGIGCA